MPTYLFASGILESDFLSQIFFRKSSLCPSSFLYKYNSVNVAYRETVSDYCKNYTNRDISVSIAIRLRCRQWINRSAISYNGQRHFPSSGLLHRIWDPPSPTDNGNTLIYVNMVRWKVKTSSQFTVEIKNTWLLTTTTQWGVKMWCYIRYRRYFVARNTQIIRIKHAKCRHPNVKHLVYQYAVYHCDLRTWIMWAWIN